MNISKKGINDFIEKRPFTITTILLFIISIISYWEFLFGGRLYVICSDMYDQFIPEINNIINSISEGNFPMWSFSRGLGQQITVGNPNWIGDIFTVISMLFGKKFFVFTFGFTMVLKIILSGMFFYMFLKELKVGSFTRILFSILYAFNGHMICRGIWIHYATEVVYVAFWLWGLELYSNKKNKFIYPISFALLLLARNASYIYIYSGLSFFYMIFRDLFKNKFSLKNILKFIPYYILGLGLSSVLVLPGIYAILSSSRISGNNLLASNPFAINGLLDYITTFSKSFSYSIMGAFSTTGSSKVILEDQVLYCGIITMIIIPQIFTFRNAYKSEKRIIYIMLGLVSIYYIFPYIRYFLNAFSSTFYKTSSFWSIIFLLLSGVYVCDKLEKKEENINITNLLITSAIYISIFVSIMLYDKSLLKIHQLVVCVLIILLITALLVIFSKYKNKIFIKYMLLFTIAIEIVLGIYMELYSDKLPKMNKENNYTYYNQTYSDGTKEIVKELKKENYSFFRIIRGYSNKKYQGNDPQIQEYYGTTQYTSIMNKEKLNFYNLFNIERPNDAWLAGFDDRPYLNTMVSVRYFLRNNQNEKVPIGYDYLFTGENGIEVYENRNFLPLGYVYSNFITDKEFKELEDYQKDETIIKAVVVDENEKQDLNNWGEMNHFVPKYETVKENCIMQYGTNMNIIANEFPKRIKYTSNNNDPSITLSIDNPQKNRAYRIKMKIKSSINTGGQIYYENAVNEFNGDKVVIFDVKKGTKEYTVNFNSMEEVEKLRLDVGDDIGDFEVTDVEIYSNTIMSYDEYSEYIEKLRETTLNIDKFSENHILGDIDMKNKGFLFLSIPYDRGWTLKVDGIKKDMIVANGGFSGTFLEEGKHEIELSYSTPYLRLGAFISLCSVTILLAYWFYSKNKESM